MVSQNLSSNSSEESLVEDAVIFLIGFLVLIAVFKFWQVPDSQNNTVALREPIRASSPLATPQIDKKPSDYQDSFIPIARNFMPITKFRITSFNPTIAVPKIPEGLKNISPLSQILASRGQVVYNDYQDIYVPKNTIDANWTTNWRTTSDDSPYFSYITYSFDKPIKLSQIRYRADWDSKAGYDDEINMSFWVYEESSGSWQLLGAHTLTKKTMMLGHILSFSPVITRGLRVQYDDPDELWGGWGNIYEVQAIGSDAFSITRENGLIPVVQ
jgi:hypothetical protein